MIIIIIKIITEIFRGTISTVLTGGGVDSISITGSNDDGEVSCSFSVGRSYC